MSGGWRDAVWSEWGYFLEDMGRVSGQCGEAIWWIEEVFLAWEGHLEGMGRLSGG